MKVIDMLNDLVNDRVVYPFIKYYNRSSKSYEIMLNCEENIINKLDQGNITLYDEIEGMAEHKEEPQEHKIPKKLDIVLLDQSDNWTRKYNKNLKDFESAHIELNPYVIDVIRQNTLEFQSKINEILDYLEEKEYKGYSYKYLDE